MTYVKAWDEIRQVFARTARAVSRGITARDFSFNSPGGRCEVCRGTGWQTIDMQFLADVTVRCDTCDGRRFQNRVLAVRHRGTWRAGPATRSCWPKPATMSAPWIGVQRLLRSASGK